MTGEGSETLLRALVVEDHEEDALLCIRELQKGGYHVDFLRVERREEFVRALGNATWDVILCDYTLPKFIGSEALALNRNREPALPFIYVSGTIGEERAIEALQDGADDYILKYNLKRLVPAVRRALAAAAERNERKALEEQLIHAQKMEALGQLTGGIAHDFNNVMAAVIGNLEMLPLRLHHPAEARKLAEEARDAAHLGADLVRRLMGFARRLPLQAEPGNLSGLLRETEVILRRTLGDPVALRLDLEPGLWDCLVDRVQLDTAILNLAINGRDAMPEGGRLTISTRNVDRTDPELRTVDAAPDGDYVRLSVSDTGSGIDDAIVARVFDPFFTTKPVGLGTGLGLSMVHGFVTQSGGAIRLETSIGSGTTVHLYFPRAAPSPADGVSRPDPAPAPVPDCVRILVVEDNPAVRRTVTGMLEGLGHHVVSVEDGSAALSILRGDHAVDLLFADVNLPGGLLGTDLALEVRNRHPEIRIILTSGSPEQITEEVRTRMDRFGTFIPKPWTLSRLRKAISDVMT